MWQKVAKFKGAEYFRKALYIKNLFPTILQSIWHSCQHPGPQMKLVYFPIYAFFIPPPVLILYIGQTDQFPTSSLCHPPPPFLG